MLNSFLVMKKPIGVSGFLSKLGHHPFRSSEVLSSPTVVLKRGAGTGTSAFFPSLRGFPTRPIKSTPPLTICSHDDEDDVIEDSDTQHHGQRDIFHCVYGECRCHIKEDDGAVYVTFQMPEEVDNKDVKVTVEKTRLIIKGERKENDEILKYCCKFKLEPARLKMNEIKAEIKKGLVVVVVLPKMKKKERYGIIHVKVD